MILQVWGKNYSNPSYEHTALIKHLFNKITGYIYKTLFLSVNVIYVILCIHIHHFTTNELKILHEIT